MTPTGTATAITAAAARPSERRATGAALAYWDRLRGERNCPTLDEIEPDSMPDLSPYVYVVEIEDKDARRGTFRYGGRAMRILLRGDPRGRRADSCLPAALRERMIQVWQAAAEVRQPLAESSQFSDGRGTTVLYRSAVMPLDGPDGRVRALFGVFSYKTAGTA